MGSPVSDSASLDVSPPSEAGGGGEACSVACWVAATSIGILSGGHGRGRWGGRWLRWRRGRGLRRGLSGLGGVGFHPEVDPIGRIPELAEPFDSVVCDLVGFELVDAVGCHAHAKR